MNPRHRRLLIPALLIALVAVTLIASIVDANAARRSSDPKPVSTIDDARITEASGMAVSRKDKDLVYVINDSGNTQAIYAVELSSGRVVGTSTVAAAPWRDPEAMTIDTQGTLWIADTGDNLGNRSDPALYSVPEPGRGDRVVNAKRYSIAYPETPRGAKHFNVEALLADPRDGRLYLVTKAIFGATVLELGSRLSENGPNPATALPGTVGSFVTDAVFSSDGDCAYLLSALGGVEQYRTSRQGWEKASNLGRARLRQPETLALDASADSLLVGTEGRPAPLLRLPISTSRVAVEVSAGVAIGESVHR